MAELKKLDWYGQLILSGSDEDIHMTLNNYTKVPRIGADVIYIPNHADSRKHPDCERGVIKDWNDYFVFVVYNGETQAKATKYTNLIYA